jgi:hypothetical protein
MAVNGTLTEHPPKQLFSIGLNGSVRRFFSGVYIEPKLEQSFRRGNFCMGSEM